MKFHLKQVRTEMGISQRKLSMMSGVSEQEIAIIENGKSAPTLTTLCKIALALKVCAGVLFSCTDNVALDDKGCWRERIIFTEEGREA